MQDTFETKLPSGALLKVRLASFADGKALYQAMLRELKGVGYNGRTDIQELVKDAFCVGLSSPAIDAAIKACMKQCTIDYGNGDERITDDVFEPAEARGDYVKVLVEVVKQNLLPFGKSLFADFMEAVALIAGAGQRSTSPTMSSSPT